MFPDCYCCNYLHDKRWEGRPRSCFLKPIASVCHLTPRSEHALFLYKCFFSFMFGFVCFGWQNQAVCLCQVASKPLEMHHEAFRERFFKADSGFWMALMFQGWSSVSWRWRTFRATKHQQSNKTCWKNVRTHLRRPSPNNLWANRHCWDQLWSLPGDLNRKFEHALPCREVSSLNLDKWSKGAVYTCVLSYERRLTRT
jgi:hypothetical protein